MTKLDDALLTVTQLGFDTPPIIYFVERHTKYLDLACALVTIYARQMLSKSPPP